jgi:hypothetical protein
MPTHADVASLQDELRGETLRLSELVRAERDQLVVEREEWKRERERERERERGEREREREQGRERDATQLAVVERLRQQLVHAADAEVTYERQLSALQESLKADSSICTFVLAYVSIPSAYVSIRQHTDAHTRPPPAAYVMLTYAYVSIPSAYRQHTSAYVSILTLIQDLLRQHTSC